MRKDGIGLIDAFDDFLSQLVGNQRSFVMLVLSRKKDERIFINVPRSGQIEIMICEVDQGKVKMGFNAPVDFKIEREEIANSPKNHCFAG